MSTPLDFWCPKCRDSQFMTQGDELTRYTIHPITKRSTEVVYREVACLAPRCDYTGEYVPWRETSQHVYTPPLPLTQPPPRSNMALILDAQRMVLASAESCGIAVRDAMSFEHAGYIVWCAGSVLRRVRTAQRELIKAEGERARDMYRYHHVWDGIGWNEFWFSPGWIEHENALDTVDTR